MTDLNQTAFQKYTGVTVEKMEIDTLVVGAGQAGVAMSEHLSKLGVPHLVLERNRIAEAWRTGRWDSLVANGPAWHDRFPGLEFDGLDPDAFASKDQVAAYFEAYAKTFDAPIRTGVEVKSVVRNADRPGFTIETSEGVIEARRVVSATGPFQRPIIPPIAPKDDAITQIHSAQYYNPQQLPEGAVLVVGAGSSGVQIADELQRAGKQVYLSVGPHDRPPRAYRNRDFCWWLGVLGLWDMEAAQPGKEHVTIAVSGARGGHTVDFRALAKQGITLVGLTKAFEDGVVTFQSDLADNLARGDENYLALLDAADAYIARNRLDLPEEPEARFFLPQPECVTNPILELDLAKAGVTSIIWATGYAVDFSWLKVNAFDGNGKPQHQRGVSSEPGIYFVGLPWLSRRGSTFIWGVWHDAKHIADHIATQCKYLAYRDAGQRQAES
ncbi:FAD-dependent oxidoreductase [Pseudomonas sp. BN417]|uniref:flavin-containing monooxygenase n=1 Tax=Pseudomonas sp. BN417 TaxID=2567890 RepID=UPI002457950C|nr:NAD(P)/FAD-dependent oxidoreductase [Pseudomonas sp. BN417]MDH4554956.1 FAD-dependent oxidoreductase [Pseudomonas sp. BN417]